MFYSRGKGATTMAFLTFSLFSLFFFFLQIYDALFAAKSWTVMNCISELGLDKSSLWARQLLLQVTGTKSNNTF